MSITQTEKFNVSYDFGHLLINDAQPFNKESITETDIKQKGTQNLQVFFRDLFKLCGNQVGDDNENQDFDKPKDTVKLPETILKLPRSKPIPKPKPLSKWEKFRLEKGLPPRKKRSRMVYSELAQDWVPRWGKGSAKNIEEKSEWAIEEKAGEEGKNPFTLRKQQKALNIMKEKKKELKNYQNAEKESKKSRATNSVSDGNVKIKDKKAKQSEEGVKNKKTKGKSEKLEKDKKGLSKTLETVQKSTASMGKFDKKLKNEKELNPLKKNKISKDILLNRKAERDRDRQILDNILGNKKSKKN